MKKVLASIIFLNFLFITYSQTSNSATGQKHILSIGTDLVPLATVGGTSGFGFGGSLAFEIISAPKTSVVANSGYMLYSAYPGAYGGFNGDIEFIPTSFTLRKFVHGGFYLGPKIGFNLDVAIPQHAYPSRKTVTIFGGMSLGLRSKTKKLTPDFSLLYHNTSLGTMITFQSSLRYQFLR